MRPNRKIKLLISLSLLTLIILVGVVVFQVVKINQTKDKLSNQEKQIAKLEQELDFWKNKNNNSNYEEIN